MVDTRGQGVPEDLGVIGFVDPLGREPREADGKGKQHPKLEGP